MSYFNVEFAMPGDGGNDGGSGKSAGSLQAVLQQAGDFLVQRNFVQAIEVLEGVLEGAAAADPSSVPLYQMLTTAYVSSKRISDAKRALERLREFGVKAPMLSVQLAVVTLGMRRFDDAIFYFREAQTLGAEPGEWGVLFGNALVRTGQLGEAEEVYQDVTPICNELRYDLFFGLSTIRMQQERYHEAAELALHALKAKKPKTRAIYFLGLAAMRMGEPERAIRMFRDFVRLQQDSVAPYRWLERLTRKLGDNAEADSLNMKAREMLENRRILRLEKQRHGSG